MTDTDRTKFALALLVVALASVALLMGRIEADHWVAATTWTVAAYMLGQPAAVLASGYTRHEAPKKET